MRRPVYFYTYVEASVGPLIDRFSGPPAQWLPGPATELGAGRYTVRLRAGELLPVDGVDTEVRIAEPATPTSARRLVVRPLSWRARPASRVLPSLTGDLELEVLTEGLGRLALSGSYLPTVSVADNGNGTDGVTARVPARHVAEATVRRFVLDVARRLRRASTLSA